MLRSLGLKELQHLRKRQGLFKLPEVKNLNSLVRRWAQTLTSDISTLSCFISGDYPSLTGIYKTSSFAIAFQSGDNTEIRAIT
jgi:hypothetical protein